MKSSRRAQGLVVAWLVAWAWIIPISGSSAENGRPFMRVYTPEDYEASQQIWAVEQDTSGVMYLATFEGVLAFDGERWQTIPHPRNNWILSLARDRNGVIYAGGVQDLMVLESNPLRLRSLSPLLPDTLTLGNVTDVIPSDEGIFFRDSGRLGLLRRQPAAGQDSVQIWPRDDSAFATFIDTLRGEVVIHREGRGVLVFRDDRWQPLITDPALHDVQLRGLLPLGDRDLLAITYKNGLLRIRDGHVEDISGPLQRQFGAVEMTGGVLTPDGRIVLSTLRSGMVFLDAHTAEPLQVLTSGSGLPSNGIRAACFIDREGSLWAPTDFGVAQVKVASPLRFYDGDNGLYGYITDILEHRGQLYVTTGEGLFVRERRADLTRPATFTSLPFTHAACWDLVSTDTALYIAGHGGLYELANDGRHRQISDTPLYHLHHSETFDRIYAGTLRDGLMLYDRQADRLLPMDSLATGIRSVREVVEDDTGALWATVQTYEGFHLERLQLDDNGDRIVQRSVYDVHDTTRHRKVVIPLLWQGRVFAVSQQDNLLAYNPDTDRFEVDHESIPWLDDHGNGMMTPHVDSDGWLWFLSDMYTFVRVRPGVAEMPAPLLRDAHLRVSFAIRGSGRDVWIGGYDGRLIHVDLDRLDTFGQRSTPPVYLRSVSVADSTLLGGIIAPSSGPIRLPTRATRIHIEYALPWMGSAGYNEYRIKLAGYDDNWREWNTENHVDFMNLPAGRYHLMIEGRPTGGLPGPVAIYPIEAPSPWYSAWYAWLLYVVAAVLLLYALYKIRLQRVLKRNRDLEQQVRERTELIEQNNLELAQAYAKIQQYNTRLEQMLDQRTRHLVQAERQAAFAQLVQGIVHNLRGPLTASSSAVQVLRMRRRQALQDLENSAGRDCSQACRTALNEGERSLAAIEHAQETLTSMINGLMTKSRTDQDDRKRAIDLNDLLRRELEFLSADRFLKNRVTVEKQFADPGPAVHGVSGDLAQIVENIVRNALDALHGHPNPRITIRTGHRDSKVRLIIADNGPGIPEAVRKKIFDPFFTTKPSLEDAATGEPFGTGLGLWMVRELVEANGGSITVESQVGQGTSFVLDFPPASAAERQDEESTMDSETEQPTT